VNHEITGGELFVGHYSASFLAKSLQKTIPLWLLFLAVQLVDILWAIFVLLGIEKVRIVPGITASNALDLYYMPFTHSLAGAIFWSALAFRLCQFFPSLRGWRIGLLVGGGVFSHWVLDVIVHRPDLALYDNTLKMGLGLWNYRTSAFILEVAVLIAGAILYLRTIRRKGRIIVYLCLLILTQAVGTFLFPPPSSDRAAALTALFFYIIFAVVAFWAEEKQSKSHIAEAAE
jgi:hypothetical protein